ncbi:tyrosine-type recombinase/integrase [Vibrio sp. TH_r3]|uniref:tyrosine-type recombinase/integrase n=1 Tax=Vibrio sp. TH_r3 TaxID=3082084 RepID=UPI0029538FD2|nr:tyrosine-type recombinase/integrase [Vibrio sp. TH_r3]MDV7106083.1 tyrosine-type recombinase/integrase [Vibrio sp. TH_r3]
MVKSTEIGVEARSKKRVQAQERVKSFALDSFAQLWPDEKTLLKQSDVEFKHGWNELIALLFSKLSNTSDFRLAHNSLVNHLSKLNKEGLCKFTPPNYLVTHRQPKQLRTQKWQSLAWATYDWYREWEATLQGKTQFTNVTECYRAVLISFIFHSGQAQEETILAFNDWLHAKSKPINHWGSLPFISIRLKNKDTNVRINDERQTIKHCYLQPVTLGLINRWKKHAKTEWEAPTERRQILDKLGLSRFSKNRPNSLKGLCLSAGYVIERLPGVTLNQALLETMVERTTSYGLPLENLSRLHLPDVQHLAVSSFYHFDSPVKERQNHSIDRENTAHSPDFYLNLKSIINEPTRNKDEKNHELRQRLQDYLDKYSNEHPIHHTFVRWLMRKSETCTRQTVYKYAINLIRRWALINEQYPLSQLSSDDIGAIYNENIQNIAKPKPQQYFLGRLKDLHAFAVGDIGLAPLPSDFFSHAESHSHVRAGFVDEGAFTALLSHIEQLNDITKSQQRALQTICILCYRVGLRPNEALKLQYSNMENSNLIWTSIRENQFGDNKTAAALRKVPLGAFLLKHEFAIVDTHIKTMKKQGAKSSHRLFSHNGEPFESALISNFVGRTLRALTNQPHFVFYHLRHSALSRMQLIIELDDELDNYPNLVPYSNKQRDYIRKTILGSSKQNRYYALSAFAGHESASMTFKHYLHFSDWIIGLKLAQHNPTVSQKQAVLLGLCSRQKHREILNRHGEVRHNDCNDAIHKKVKVLRLPSCLNNPTTPKPVHITQKEEKTFDICRTVLSHIAQGLSVKELAFDYNLSQDTIDKWYRNALYIKSLTTNSTQRKSRHFSDKRMDKLTPGELKSPKERKLANRIMLAIRTLYTDKNADSKDDIQSMLKYALTHTSVTKSGITFDSPSTLNKFIQTFASAIPKSHWRIVKIHLVNAKNKEEWNDVLKGIRQITDNQATGKKAQIRLELISPDQANFQEKAAYKKYSSHVLMYLLHMMAIMMLNI